MENPNLFPGRTDHFVGKGKRTRPNTENEEVEDMAKCLMLLSRGKKHDPSLIIDGQDYQTVDRCSKLYQCKTCDKGFVSFQALGGHRASHKKPRKAALILSDCRNPNPNPSSTTRPRKGRGPGVGIKPSTNKAHECSICGSVFGSGQALGGHMRRHRPVNADVASSGESYKKARSSNYVLELDLNLPAPEDSDSGDSLSCGFGFALSAATPLVDCRY